MGLRHGTRTGTAKYSDYFGAIGEVLKRSRKRVFAMSSCRLKMYSAKGHFFLGVVGFRTSRFARNINSIVILVV